MSIEQASADIAWSTIEAVRAQRRRSRDRGPMQTIDGLLAELEELQLCGGKRVPDRFVPRLEALNQRLPAASRREMRSRVTIVHLMDALFEIQDELLGRSGGGSAAEDEDAEGDVSRTAVGRGIPW